MECLRVNNRSEWREWLSKNFDKKKEIWLVINKPRKISYNDSVEEALCFGWIDSIVKKIDKNRTVQRFSPRRSNSRFSQPNKERLKWLLKKNMIHPFIIDSAKKVVSEKFVFPEYIIKEIKKDNAVWENYNKFSYSYQRIRIAYIDAAKKHPLEFKKRLNNFIKKCRDNKMIGFGGINKYY